MTVLLLGGLVLGVLAAIGIACTGASEHLTVSKIQAERQLRLDERQQRLNEREARLAETRQRHAGTT